MIRFLTRLTAASVALSASCLLAQTPLQRQLSRIDLGVQAVGEFTGDVSGMPTIPAPNQGQVVTISPSNTVGALITVRYSARPYLGAEFNGGYSRYTENLGNTQPTAIQTQADEFTLGYLVIPPYTVFGLKPYASAGIGGIRFSPTRGGGQGAPAIGKFAVYYNVGVQKNLFSENFGIRAGFRQLYFTAPDFYQNYLTIDKRTHTSEPMIGFFLRF